MWEKFWFRKKSDPNQPIVYGMKTFYIKSFRYDRLCVILGSALMTCILMYLIK